MNNINNINGQKKKIYQPKEIYRKVWWAIEHKRKTGENLIIKTKTKNFIILPNANWIGLIFDVYNGKFYEWIFIDSNKFGYYLGEFVLYQRKKAKHKKQKNMLNSKIKKK